MRKFLMISIFLLTGPQILWASPTAGFVNINAYSDYENPTQYIFSHYNILEYEDISESETVIPVYSVSDSERLYLKQTIMAECGYNQPDEGVVMATDVILNRLQQGWADSIYDVITQPGQFETYSNGMIQEQDYITEQVDRIVDNELMYGSSYPGLLYFTAGEYNPYCIPWKKVGDHYFGY